MRMTAAIAVAIRTHTNLVLLRATGSSAAIHRVSLPVRWKRRRFIASRAQDPSGCRRPRMVCSAESPNSRLAQWSEGTPTGDLEPGFRRHRGSGSRSCSHRRLESRLDRGSDPARPSCRVLRRTHSASERRPPARMRSRRASRTRESPEQCGPEPPLREGVSHFRELHFRRDFSLRRVRLFSAFPWKW